MSKKYFMANPNFSEGRDLKVIEEIVATVKDSEDVIFVKSDPEMDFNRTVVTIIGEAEPLKKALIKLTEKSVELIDMSKHEGTHPRMGAMDIIIVFPFKNATMEDCNLFCKDLGQELFDKLEIPIFYSAEIAVSEERRKIPFIRKGQYEGLKALLEEIKDDPDRADEYNSRKPDLSVDGLLSEKAGGTIIFPMKEVAAFFNIFLDTEDLSIAKKIASSVRNAGGGFSTVAAVGIRFDERPGTVVSMNIMDCDKTPIYRPFEFVKMEAARYGVTVTGSELVGIVRLDSLINCFEHQLQLEGFEKEHIIETHMM